MRLCLLAAMLAAVSCVSGFQASGAMAAPLPASGPQAAAVHSGWAPPPRSLPQDRDRVALTGSRPLMGTGAVAFHPLRPRLAWADGETLRTLDLDDGTPGEIPLGLWISDLGFSPAGDLWVIAGEAQRWHDGTRACRSAALDLERLLGVDADGAAAARYEHGDGIGPIRHQVWLDNDCRTEREHAAPLPAGIDGASDDPGEPAQRAGLRLAPAIAGGLPWRIDRNRVDAGTAGILTLPAAAVAVSPDGRWWVLEEEDRRALWQLDAAD